MRDTIASALEFLRSLAGRRTRPARPYASVAFVPKARPGDPMPWIAFGSTKEEYEKWIPEVCGICCLKMAGDTFGATVDHSLYDLLIRCLKKGGFKVRGDGTIAGVFHKPLIALANGLGLRGSVEKDLSIAHIKEHLARGRMSILSVDLAKATQTLNGSHLVLVHRYLPETDVFLVHDCAYALGREGADIPMTAKMIASVSNGRGMTIWKAAGF